MTKKIVDFLRILKRQFYIRKYQLKYVDRTFIACKNCHISKDFIAGAYSYVGPGCSIYPRVKIGKYTMIANDVRILGGDHYYKKVGIPIIFAGRSEIRQTIIEDDVWIGASSIIMTGVTIGNGVIVAAGSVVTKNLMPYGIYGGVPAQLIKMRFTEDEIKIHESMLQKSISSFSEDIVQVLSGKL